MPAPELTDLSLLILADLGVKQSRNQQRLNTLIGDAQGSNWKNPPTDLKALADAGLVEIRRTGSADGYKAEITDRGLLLHRCLMAALRNAKALIASSDATLRTQLPAPFGS